MPKKPTEAEARREAVFEALRAILEPYAGSFKVSKRRGFYSLSDNSVRGWSISFAAVVAKRTAVSFYLMAQHYSPDLLEGASESLMARRMKSGKFFNFKEVDTAHIAELAKLIAKSLETWDPIAITKR